MTPGREGHRVYSGEALVARIWAVALTVMMSSVAPGRVPDRGRMAEYILRMFGAYVVSCCPVPSAMAVKLCEPAIEWRAVSGFQIGRNLAISCSSSPKAFYRPRSDALVLDEYKSSPVLHRPAPLTLLSSSRLAVPHSHSHTLTLLRICGFTLPCHVAATPGTMIAKIFDGAQEPVVLHEDLKTTFMGAIHPISTPDAPVHQYLGIKYASIPARFRQSKLHTRFPPQVDCTHYGFVTRHIIYSVWN